MEDRRTYWEFTTENKSFWVIFESEVISEIDRHRQHEYFQQPESCGVLLGEIRGDHIIVTNVSTPFPSDKRTPVGYHRDPAGHQQLVNYYHKISSGEIQYIGEWHTHPQLNAKPSMTDYIEWARTMEIPTNKFKKLIFFIAGIEQDWLGAYDKNILLKGVAEVFD